ncbi:nucleotidyl transferase AbiEii/AbiGii toxin family protein [Chitinimonas arctica]|uniref:nucleotidyl transferase AbiEii/AbiGii toxin family protein n=1 Tax=Chitinimonas arctica TaxID=2594795 RepID=UPI0015D13830|nr:nucleotidyl transferase AbiEii/AbiGii toxin family protein [Chitinimonas arctica]
MDTSKLRPDTQHLWETLRWHSGLRGFVLIGGTALALRIGHRLSEDLDFAYNGRKLPKRQIQAMVRDLQQRGTALVLNQPATEIDEFINAGLDLYDFQQNFDGNETVKVSLVCLDTPANSILKGTPDDMLRVATLDEIFALKALVVASRSKTRDWFDLYVLMTRHGYSAADFLRAFHLHDADHLLDSAVMRLRHAKPAIADAGYDALLEDAPSLETMRDFFNATLDELEAERSRAVFTRTR